MIKAILRTVGTNGQISMEERMGCGVGICMGCTIETHNGYKRVCKEGPVFNAEELTIDSSYLGKASNDRLKPYGDFVSLFGEVRPFPRTQPLNGTLRLKQTLFEIRCKGSTKKRSHQKSDFGKYGKDIVFVKNQSLVRS
jgi:hypothetical protein